MADLTSRLPLTEGTNRVIDDPANPSFIGAAADFASQALSGYAQLKQDESKRKADKAASDKAAAEAAIAYDVTGAPAAAAQVVAQSNTARMVGQAAQESWAPDMTARPLSDFDVDTGMFRETDVPASLEKEARRSALQGMSIVTAVEQGKMPEITMNSALNAKFRELREKYPDHTEYLLDVWKKTGLDANLFTEAKDAQDWHDYERESAQTKVTEDRKRKESYITTAEAAYGPDALNMTEEEKIVQGMRIVQQAEEIKRAKEAADLKLSNANLSATQKTEVEKDLNQTIETSLNNLMYNDAVPYIKSLQDLANSLTKDPNNAEHMKRWQEMGVRVNQLISQAAESAVQHAIASEYTGDLSKLKQRFTDAFGNLTQMFTGEHSLVQANVDALRAIETSAKIDTAQALPFMTALTRAGMKPTEIPGFLKAVDGNPDLKERLNKEIKGYITDWGEDRASTHLMNAIKIMRGETTLAYMAPGEAAKQISSLVYMNRALSKDYVSGKDVDGDKVVNMTGELTVATRTITASSGSNLILVATKSFADNTTRLALVKAATKDKGTDKTMAMATLQASRAASAHLLNHIRLASSAENKSQNLFKVGWDDRNGRYFLNDLGWKRAMQVAKSNVASVRGAGAGLETGSAYLGRLQAMKPPKSVLNLIDAGNENLENAIDLGRVDPSAPKATDIQLRRWYGQNIPLPSDNQDKPIDVNKEIDKQFDNLENMLEQGLDKAVQPVSLPYSQHPSYSKYQGALKAAADKYSVPEPVLSSLIHFESKFNPSAEGPEIKEGTHKGDRAYGLGQVMRKTAAGYGVSDRTSLSEADQIDLVAHILSDNKNAGGDWRDAVSRYFTGVDYKTAKKQGRSDGFTDVISYVEGIM